MTRFSYTNLTPEQKAKRQVINKAYYERKKAAIKPPAKKQHENIVQPKGTKKQGSINYTSNANCLAAIEDSRKLGRMSESLGRIVLLIAEKYSQKANFKHYTYREDMVANAVMQSVTTWKSFKPEKSSNAFSFLTQCIHNSFLGYLNKEKLQRNIRDKVCIESGVAPPGWHVSGEEVLDSVRRQEEVESNRNAVMSEGYEFDM